MNDKTRALLRSLFAVDEEGQIFLRVTTGEPAGVVKNAVNLQSNRSLDTLLSGAVVLDTKGQPALRLAAVSFGSTVEAADKKRTDSMRSNEAKRKKAQAKKDKAEAKRRKAAAIEE